MMFLLTLCSALLTAGAALKCEVCSATNANSCSGSYETCESPESRCMVTLTETSLGHNDMRNAILDKHCGSAYDCTHPATLSTPELRVRVTTKCCNTDFCNNGTMNWTPPNSTLNGVTCESCFARNSETCNVMTPLNCTGDEIYCVQYSASRQEGILYSQMCDDVNAFHPINSQDFLKTFEKVPRVNGILEKLLRANRMKCIDIINPTVLYGFLYKVGRFPYKAPRIQDSRSSIAVAGCASESMQKSQGKAAFQGSTIVVKGMQNRNGAECMKHYPLLLPSLALAIIWMVSQ